MSIQIRSRDKFVIGALLILLSLAAWVSTFDQAQAMSMPLEAMMARGAHHPMSHTLESVFSPAQIMIFLSTWVVMMTAMRNYVKVPPNKVAVFFGRKRAMPAAVYATLGVGDTRFAGDISAVLRLADEEVRTVSPAPKEKWATGNDVRAYELEGNLSGRNAQKEAANGSTAADTSANRGKQRPHGECPPVGVGEPGAACVLQPGGNRGGDGRTGLRRRGSRSRGKSGAYRAAPIGR